MSRRLTGDEAALWARLAHTVRPMAGRPRARGDEALPSGSPPPLLRPGPVPAGPAVRPLNRASLALGGKERDPAPVRALDRHGLDGGWDRRLAGGLVVPDFTLDLHGASLDAAHARLEQGIALALAQHARVMLLVTGRPRPAGDPCEHGPRRGAIRARFLDWLAAGPHAGRIAAVRPAHPRHGGAGAVYVVLRRSR